MDKSHLNKGSLKRTFIAGILVALVLGLACCGLGLLPYFCKTIPVPFIPCPVRDALEKEKKELDQIPIPPTTNLLSEYATTTCCGNGNHDELDLVVTRLYSSRLAKNEINEFYHSLPKSQEVPFIFVDDALQEGPEGPDYLPCFLYRLFTGHHIPAAVPDGETWYIIYSLGFYGKPGDGYCH